MITGPVRLGHDVTGLRGTEAATQRMLAGLQVENDQNKDDGRAKKAKKSFD